MRGIWCLALLTAASALPAQGVSPSHFANSEGNFGLSHGIGNGADKNRLLQIIKVSSRVRSISEIGFRRDGSTRGIYGAGAIVADMFISSGGKSFPTINTTFDANHGPNKTQVATSSVFVFPDTDVGPVPHDWVYTFPFDQPFQYPGSKPIVWEMLTHYRTNSQTLIFDAAGNWDDDPAPFSQEVGQGCTATNNASPATLTGGAFANWIKTTDIDWVAGGLPPGPGLLTVGMDPFMFGALPLPLTLPGTETAPSGPCTLYNDIIVAMPITVEPDGTFALSANFSLKKVGNGMSIYSQAIGLDAGANDYGAVFTNMLQHHFIRPFGTTQSVAHSFINGGHGPVGTVVKWQGYVVKI